MNGITVKAQLNATYTGDTVNYIQTFMRDVNGGLSLPKEEQVMKKLTTQFKKAATYASMSVAVQQPTSILRAMCMINPKYFAGRKNRGAKKREKTSNLVVGRLRTTETIRSYSYNKANGKI